jgi:uncharacterized protein YbcI
MRSQGEIEAAVCCAVARFQQDYLGRGPRDITAHLVDDKLVVHLSGALSAAEQRLLGEHDGSGRRGADLLKQLRGHLVTAGRPLLEQLVARATGSQLLSIHHDLSTVTGEEVIVVMLSSAPCFRPRYRR